MNYHLMFKILLVGDVGVGKSALLHLSGAADESPWNVGVDFLKKKLEIGGKKVKLQIWDITGQNSSQAITTSYYHGTQGFILVYDVTNETSFQHISEWLSIIQQHASEEDFQKLLFANKRGCDEKTRRVAKERGQALAREHGMRFVESADIDEAIKLLTEDILNKDYEQPTMERTELFYENTVDDE